MNGIEKWGWAESGGLAQGLAELLCSLVELEPTPRRHSALGEVTQELALVVRTRAGSGPRTAIPSPVRGLVDASVLCVGRGVLGLPQTSKALLSEETFIISAAQQAWPAGLLMIVVAFLVEAAQAEKSKHSQK